MSENVDLVHRLARLWAEGGPAAAAELFHEDFEMTDHPEHPETAVYHGREAAYESVEQWMEMFDHFEWEVKETIDLGEHVVVVLEERARVRGSNALVDHSYGVLVTVRDGKLARVQWFADRDTALAAARAENYRPS